MYHVSLTRPMSPSLKISEGLGAVVNLDFIAAFAVGGCKLAIPALEKFTVHMSIPPMLAMTVILAYMTSLLFLSCKCCTKDNEYRIKMTNVRKQTSIKIVMFVAQIMYPGLATRIFSIYRCRTVAFSLHDSIEVFNAGTRIVPYFLLMVCNFSCIHANFFFSLSNTRL